MKKEDMHPNQIITNKKTINEIMLEENRSIVYNTVLLLMLGELTPDYKLRLYSVSSKLYFISSLVYSRNGWIGKPRDKDYIKRIFEPRTETAEEVKEIIKYWCDSLNLSFGLIYKENYVYEKLQLLEKVWARFLSCVYEQPFLHEFAYAYEYIYNAPGGLPNPEYLNDFCLFPENYEDFTYDNGVAKYFENIDFPE